MTDFVMPSLGADMESGTLVEWRIAPGREVRRGDVVAVVETQKGAIEIEIFEDGVVEEICVPLGREVPWVRCWRGWRAARVQVQRRQRSPRSQLRSCQRRHRSSRPPQRLANGMRSARRPAAAPPSLA